MNIFSLIDDVVCERLMLTFAHFLWQGVALGLLAGLLGFLMRNRSAQARYLVFTAALLAMVACPPVTYQLLPSPARPIDEVVGIDLESTSTAWPDIFIDHSAVTPDVSSEDELNSNGTLFAEAHTFPVPDSIETTSEVPAVQIAQSNSTTSPAIVRYLTYGYMLGVLLLLGRFVLGIQGAAQIRRSSRLLDDPNILRAITRQAKAMGLRNPPSVLLCQQLLVPAVVGIIRPAILLPVAMMSGLTPQQVEVVLTHELAHIRRYDYLVNVMQRVVESFLFFHPAVWFISRRIRIEREHCCDDLVISMGTTPVDYATALLNVVQAGSTAESRLPLSRLASLPAVGNRSELRRRIERLVNSRHQPQVYVTRKGIIMTSLTTMIVLAGSMLFSATFQAEPEREDQKSAQTTTPSEQEAELPENSDASGLPEVASQNGSLTNDPYSRNEDELDTVSKPAPDELQSSQKLREQPEAKELTLVGIANKNGRSEISLLRRKDKKRFTLHKGDTLNVGKSKITITNINKSDIEFTAGGERWQLALGKTINDAGTFPSDEPHATKVITLKQIDPESLAGTLRIIYPETTEISHVPAVGLIIRGRKDQVEDLRRIAALIDGLDKGLKNDREIEAIDKFLALKRKQSDAAPAVKNDASTNRFEVFQLRWKTAEEVAKSLKDVLKKANASSDHKVEVDPKANRILVFGTSVDLKMVKALVILLDQKPEEPTQFNRPNPAASGSGGNKKNTTDSNPVRKNRRITTDPAKALPRETKIFYLKYAEAEFLSNLIKEVYHDVEKSGRFAIAVDVRTNSIVLSSESKSDLNEIEALIQAIDRKQEQVKPAQSPRSEFNPFTIQQPQPGNPNKQSTTNRPAVPWQPAAGQPTDLIRLTEAYSDAYRDLQLAKAEYDVVKEAVSVNKKSVTAFELRTAEIGIDAAQRKLGILKQIAEVEILSTIDELKNLNEQLPKVGSKSASPQVQKTLKRQLRDQQFRQQILKQLIAR